MLEHPMHKPRKSPPSWTPMSIIITASFVAFMATLTSRIVTGNVSISFATFSFNDLLTLILAMFSIGLSVSFYHQANNVSNLFYDNIYKFTQDTSVILGRIEAGFGERLRHLDEGYEGLRTSVDGALTRTRVEASTQADIIERRAGERDEIIDKLFQHSSLREDEREKLRSQLKAKDDELSEALLQFDEVSRRLKKLEESTELEVTPRVFGKDVKDW